MPRLRLHRWDEAPGLADEGRRYGAADRGHGLWRRRASTRLCCLAEGCGTFWLRCAKQRRVQRAVVARPRVMLLSSAGTAVKSRIGLFPGAQRAQSLCLPFTSAAKAGSADASEATRIRRKKVAEPSRQPRNARASRRVTRPAAAANPPDAVAATPRKDTYLRRSTAPRSRSAASFWRAPSSRLSD